LETIIVDSCTGKGIFKVLEKLSGHIDFSFACDWSSDGRIIATGSQDKTTRLYDARFMRKAFSVIPAKMSAIRSVQFNSFGNLLSIAESADFVHLVQPDSNIMHYLICLDHWLFRGDFWLFIQFGLKFIVRWYCGLLFWRCIGTFSTKLLTNMGVGLND
jgi:hypothetical protein